MNHLSQSPIVFSSNVSTSNVTKDLATRQLATLMTILYKNKLNDANNERIEESRQ